MIGEAAALGAALLWAAASIVFAEIGVHVRAVNLNIIKGVLACIVMIVALAGGSFAGSEGTSLSSLAAISDTHLWLLVISGAVGIGIGDTAYFGCIRRIGPQKGLMLESSAPVMAAMLAMALFSEMLPFHAWTGILITTSGIILVLRFSLSQELYRSRLDGIMLGLFAAFAQAAGIVLSRMSLAGGTVDPLASSLIRLVAGLAVLFAFLFLQRWYSPERSGQMQPLSAAIRLIIKHKLLLKTLVAVLAGTFFALWLQQLSVKYTSAGVAQTLLGTCPLFGMLIGAVQGRRQPAAVWLGLALGLTGIGLLFI